MTQGWHLALLRCKYEPRFILIFLSIFRVAICFWPQTGYLHPDEFFQSPDIVGGNYFDSNILSTWEFQTDRPIRCMLIPNLLNKLSFRLVTFISESPSAYTLIVAPRLAYTLLSFINDISLYKLCQFYSSRGLWYLPVSAIFQSSFVCIGCLTRTLSNSIETVILSLLLVVVCHAVRPRFQVLLVTPARKLRVNERIKTSKQLASSIFVGFLIAMGTFVRPTFPCFALVPFTYWAFQSFRRNSNKIGLTMRRAFTPLILSFSLTSIVISAYDTYYYRGSQVFGDLLDHLRLHQYDQFYQVLKANWVLTPYNFISYNTKTDNLAQYGFHPPYVHMAVNMPLAFNLLCIFFYIRLFNLARGSSLCRLIFSTHRIYALMLLATITPIILLSFIPHQEFRFLTPLIVPLSYSFAFTIYTSNRTLGLWILINMFMLYFYSSVHQAGVTKAILDLDSLLRSRQFDADPAKIHSILAFQCYMVPSYQWNIPRNDTRFEFYLHDTFDDLESSMMQKFEPIVQRQNLSQELFIMLPRLYEHKLIIDLKNHFDMNLTHTEVIKHYAPHFSGELFDSSLKYIMKHGLKGWKTAFGFSLLRIDLN